MQHPFQVHLAKPAVSVSWRNHTPLPSLQINLNKLKHPFPTYKLKHPFPKNKLKHPFPSCERLLGSPAALPTLLGSTCNKSGWTNLENTEVTDWQ